MSRYNLPLKNEVVLSAHTKSITCVAVDAPGGRVASGSMDYHMKLWDFAGMARHVRPFRDAEIEEGHPIIALSYSPTGDRVHDACCFHLMIFIAASSYGIVATSCGVPRRDFGNAICQG